jgi:hypothetical protein
LLVVLDVGSEPQRRFLVQGFFSHLVGHLCVAGGIADAIELQAKLKPLAALGMMFQTNKFPGSTYADCNTVALAKVVFDHTHPRVAEGLSLFNELGRGG